MNILQQLVDYITGSGRGDTPIFVYILSYLGAVMIYFLTNPRRKKGPIIYVKIIGLQFLLQIYCCLTKEYYVQLYFVSVVLFFLIICRMFRVSCDMNTRNIIYYSVRAYILGEMAASLDWQIIYFFHSNIDKNPAIWIQGVVLIGILVIIYIIAYFVEKLINRSQEHIHIEKQEMIISLVMLVFIYILSNLSYVKISTPFSTNHVGDRFIIRTLVDMAGVSILLAYHVQIRETHTRMEKSQMESLYQMQYSNYQVSRESVDLVNKKYNDLKNKIATLRMEIANSDRLTDLDNMEKDITQYEAQNKTGNDVLDIILTIKSIQCKNENIRMTCICDGALLHFIEPMDISSLFGNALDNAITSVEKISNLEKRMIHVALFKDKNFIRIKFENCYAEEIILKNGLPVTTKSDRRYHGFGLKSISAIAEKYNGSITISAKDGWFELRILIPLQ